MRDALTATSLDLPLVRRGKVRDVYDLGAELLIVTTDRLSAFDVVLPQGIPDKGRVLNQLSLFWFRLLESSIPNHIVAADVADFPARLKPYHAVLEGRSMVVRRTDPLPVECVVRGYLAGSGFKDYKKTGSICGLALPEGLLDSRANRRKIAIRSEVADTIDQIGVMVRAGLGLDAAIARAARSGSGPLGEEFTRVVQDMRVGVSRSVAMANLAERVDVPEVRGFVNALAQAEKLGVPISRTLEIQSGELRIKRRQLAEEQAMKLPVKILFPMVIFILPVIFIVLLGPAVIRIMDQF